MGVQFAGNILVQSNGGPLPISQGGTGQINSVLATNALLPTQSGQSGKVLSTDGTNVLWSSSAGGAPGGSDTFIQFNDAGTFGGLNKFVINKTTGALTSTSTLTNTGLIVSNLVTAMRPINFQTSGSDRWILQTNNTPEIGASVGSNFEVVSVADNGATQNIAISISRATQVANFSQTPTVSGSPVLSGIVSIANGGTGQSTAPNAINALLPTQSGQNGKVLGTDGTNVSWVTGGGGGPAAAGTLTGTTLAANVVTSSLTSLGTLTTLVVNNTIRGIDSSTTGTGTLAIRAGIPATGTSGLMSVSGGSSASGSTAGGTTIEAGHNSVSGDAGTLLLSGGNQTGSTGTGLAGDVIITGGYHQAYGSVTLNGANASIYGGNGGGGASSGGAVTLNGGVASGSGGPIVISTAPNTALVERLRFLNTGAWSVGSGGTDYGTTGQVLTSNGNTSPTWASLSVSTIAAATTIGTVANAAQTLTGFAGTSGVGSFTIRASGATGANTGGSFVLASGDTTAAGGAGFGAGDITIHADSGFGNGGAVTIRGGDTPGNGASGAAGSLTLRGGDSNNSSTSGTTGAVVIRGGNAVNTQAGGAVTISGGTSGAGGGALIFQTAATTSLTQRMAISSAGAITTSAGTSVDFGARYTELSTAVTAAATTDFDCSLGNNFAVDMNASITTQTFSNIPTTGRVYNMTLFLKQDATGSRTVAWSASVKWSGGIAPTLTTTANKTDIINLVTFDGGTTLFGFVGGLDF
jgi:hypothetical protein